jgi:hypothetical protein
MTGAFETDTRRRLGDVAGALRDRYFVGRAAELECFRSALQQTVAEGPVAVLFLYGPGGVGKSSLLRQFERIAVAARATVLRLDGRGLEPTPAGVLRALRGALDLDENADPFEVLAHLSRPVLLIDTFEVLAPVDAWVREVFLPQLPADALVVIAGRNAP